MTPLVKKKKIPFRIPFRILSRQKEGEGQKDGGRMEMLAREANPCLSEASTTCGAELLVLTLSHTPALVYY